MLGSWHASVTWVVDYRHPAPLARFWARCSTAHDPEDDPSVLVERPGVHPRFFFQLVPEGKPDEPRTDVMIPVVADLR